MENKEVQLSEGWFKTTIGEQATLQRGFDITKKQQRPGDVPVVSSGGIQSYHDTSMVQGPGVILGRKGTIGSVYYVDGAYWPHDTTLWVKDFHNNAPRFVYYFFKERGDKLLSMDVGAANPTLNRNHVHPINIIWPEVTTQKAIAHILGTLDDKIELNRRMNETLEAMAQALFKSWFVDFDPVKAKMEGRHPEGMDAETASLFPDKLVESELGLIPEGWRIGQIGNEVTVVGGSTPSTKKPEYWDGGIVHWTTPKDLSGSSAKILIETARKITEEGLQKINSGLLPVDTVLLSSRAPVGYLALAKVPIAINQGYIGMKCEKALSPEYVLQWCVSVMDKILQRASGTTFAEISKKNFKPITVVVPSARLIKIYSKIVSDIYSKIENNLRENSELSNVRDTLLPELISGKLNVSDWQ
nr:restriction endonuclease subunit S [uncultured Pseudodesulfovibrio sp.]